MLSKQDFNGESKRQVTSHLLRVAPMSAPMFGQFAFSRKQLHRVCRPQQQHWRQRQQQQLFRNRVPQVGFAQLAIQVLAAVWFSPQ
jgi:hypothetical protein